MIAVPSSHVLLEFGVAIDRELGSIDVMHPPLTADIESFFNFSHKKVTSEFMSPRVVTSLHVYSVSALPLKSEVLKLNS